MSQDTVCEQQQTLFTINADNGGNEIDEESVIQHAIHILEKRLKKPEYPAFRCTTETKTFLCLKLAGQKREVFTCLLLNTQNELIEYCEVFKGSKNECTVYPEEILKLAAQNDAAAIVLCHNHPSGNLCPSNEDIKITQKLIYLLNQINVTVLDHIIVANTEAYSMKEDKPKIFK